MQCTDGNDEIRILADHVAPASWRAITRRRFLSRSRYRRAWRRPRSWPPAAATTPARSTQWRGDVGGCRHHGRPGARVPTSLNLFTWAEYDDPDLMKKFGDDHHRRLQLQRGRHRQARGRRAAPVRLRHGRARRASTSRRWWRRACSTRSNLARIPNFANLDAGVHEPAVGPRQRVLGVQGLGHHRLDLRQHGDHDADHDVGRTSSTPPRTRAERQGDASSTRRPTSPALYFWANGIDWNTTNPADLDAAEAVPRQRARARTSRRFDSYPGINLTAGQLRRSRRCSTATPARACSKRQGPGDDLTTWVLSARRTPSCGWTTGAS